MTDNDQHGSDPTERLKTLLGADDEQPTTVEDGGPGEGAPAEHDPEAHSVRSSWQPEAERLEAAEFLVATRAQHEAKVRGQHVIDVRRDERARQGSNLRPTA